MSLFSPFACTDHWPLSSPSLHISALASTVYRQQGAIMCAPQLANAKRTPLAPSLARENQREAQSGTTYSGGQIHQAMRQAAARMGQSAETLWVRAAAEWLARNLPGSEVEDAAALLPPAQMHARESGWRNIDATLRELRTAPPITWDVA